MSTEQERAERFLFSLSSLAEVGEAIFSNRRSFGESLQWLLEMTLGMIRASRGAILLYDETTRALELHAARRVEPAALTLHATDQEIQYLEKHRLVRVTQPPEDLLALLERHPGELESLQPELWISLGVPEKFLGVMSLGPVFTGEALESSDRDFLLVLAHHISLAIYSARLLQEMREANFQLRLQQVQLLTLSEIGAEISAVLDPDELIEQILQNAVMLLDAHSGAIFMLENGDLTLRSQVGELAHLPESLPDSVVGAAIDEGDTLRKQDSDVETQDFGVSSLIVTPIQGREEAIGALMVCDRESREGPFLAFDEADESVLSGLAHQAGVAIENAQLYQAAIQLRQMEAEMIAAQEIQRGLLPDEVPEIPGYDIAGVSIPRGRIGGDYYDYVREDGDHLGLVIADVAGKGTQAALLMATLRAGLFFEASRNDLPAMILRLNDLLYKSTPADKYATFFYARLDWETGVLHSINAGHNPPLIFRKDGDLIQLDEAGTFVGAFPNDILHQISEYTVQQTPLHPGDILLLYTDGVTEANNAADELFGLERLCHVVEEHRTLAADDILQRIQQTVDTFQGDVEPFDDFTLVVLKVDERRVR